MNHILHIEYAKGSTIADCSCDRWMYETTGTDDTSRNAVSAAYAKHEGN